MATDRNRASDDELPPRPGTREYRRAHGAVDPHVARATALSRDRIVEVALEVLVKDGLDAVSMRRVASELGTGPASLYAHVGDKQELLEWMLDAVIGTVEIPEPDPARWQEQLKEAGRSIRAAWTAHNDIALVSLGNVPTTPNALECSERLLAIMAAGGVPKQLAGWFVDRFAQYIDADAYEGAILNVRFAGDREAGHAWFLEIRQFFRDLPPARFPHLTGMVEELTSGGDDQRFEFGMSLLVDGLADQVRRANEK